MPTLLSRPTLNGTMRESALYQVMNTGLTDSLMLIGHADAATMYEPYRVVDMPQAINFLKADVNSPLTLALLEAYNGGCKDIWLYAVAPMSEYEPIVANRTTAYYQQHYNRLASAYSRLMTWDYCEVVVPIDAPHYNAKGIDFTTQLVNFCKNAFEATGSVSLGVIGTRNTLTQADYTALANDTRDFGTSGKFVMLVMGEGLISHPQISFTYSAPLAVQVAVMLCTVPMNRSLAGLKLPNVSSVVGLDLTAAQKDLLAENKINPIVRSVRGKRGLAFQSKLMTDNTLGVDGTDFWSMTQMHMVANTINQVRAIGFSYIGEVDFDGFRKAVDDHLRRLTVNRYIRTYELNIQKALNGAKAIVTVNMTPILGIRNIGFTTEVGPGG